MHESCSIAVTFLVLCYAILELHLQPLLTYSPALLDASLPQECRWVRLGRTHHTARLHEESHEFSELGWHPALWRLIQWCFRTLSQQSILRESTILYSLLNKYPIIDVMAFTLLLCWWCKGNCGFRLSILIHCNWVQTSLWIKVGAIIIDISLPMRKNFYSYSVKIYALGLDKFLAIVFTLPIVEVFSW